MFKRIPYAAGSCLPTRPPPPADRICWGATQHPWTGVSDMQAGEREFLEGQLPSSKAGTGFQANESLESWASGLLDKKAALLFRARANVHVRTCVVHCRETAFVPRKLCFCNLWSVLFTDSQFEKASFHFSSSHEKGSFKLCDCLAVLISVHTKDRITRRMHSGPLPPTL